MNGKMVGNMVKGALIGLGAALLLLLLLNFIALKGNDPDRPLTVFAYVAEGVGAAAAGFIASRLNGEQGWMVGGLAGVIYTAILLLVAVVLPGKFHFLTALLVGILLILIAAGGGILGLPGEKSRRSRRRHMMKRMGQ